MTTYCHGLVADVTINGALFTFSVYHCAPKAISESIASHKRYFYRNTITNESINACMTTSNFDDKAKEWDSPEKQERAEHIADAIRSHVQLSTDMSAFEYGCGTGLLSFELRKDLGPITLADNSEGMLNVLRDKIEAKSADDMTPVKLNLSEDPLPEDRFDLVYTMMTLHHIPDIKHILNQFYDLLHFGGCLCIADLDKEDGSFHGSDADVHQGFDRSELTDLAKDIGFINIRFDTAYNMEHEINDDGDTKMFPIFLMVAVKKEI